MGLVFVKVNNIETICLVYLILIDERNYALFYFA